MFMISTSSAEEFKIITSSVVEVGAMFIITSSVKEIGSYVHDYYKFSRRGREQCSRLLQVQ